jgi:hypothetical protein
VRVYVLGRGFRCFAIVVITIGIGYLVESVSTGISLVAFALDVAAYLLLAWLASCSVTVAQGEIRSRGGFRTRRYSLSDVADIYVRPKGAKPPRAMIRLRSGEERPLAATIAGDQAELARRVNTARILDDG